MLRQDVSHGKEMLQICCITGHLWGVYKKRVPTGKQFKGIFDLDISHGNGVFLGNKLPHLWICLDEV